MTVEISGGCHCGGIRYRLSWPDGDSPVPARACGCSYCTRYAASWTSHPDAAIEVTYQTSQAPARYRFGTETADFIYCSRCGVLCLAVSEIGGRDYAVVNINTFQSPDVIRFDRSNTDFSGEQTTERLSRRRQRWIGRVHSRVLG